MAAFEKTKYLKIELILTFVIKWEASYKYLQNYQFVNILNVVSTCSGENMEDVV